MNVVMPLVDSGAVTLYSADPEYEGRSCVPAAITIKAWEPARGVTFRLLVWARARDSA